MKAKPTKWRITYGDSGALLPTQEKSAVDFTSVIESIPGRSLSLINDSYCINGGYGANYPIICDDYFSRVVERKNFICKS